MSADNPSYRLYARMISNFLNFAPSRELLVRLPTAIESFRERFNLRGEFFRNLRDLTIAPFFGNSVACRLVDVHEINHSTLILGKWRAVQRIEFNIGDRCIDSAAGKHAIHNEDGHESYKVWIVNTHLDHEHQDIRQEQALAVADWMEREKHDIAAIVLCGDFNGGPDEKFHSELKSLGYFSGYKFLHGMEPRSTWPTGIQAPFMDHGDAECLDYIYLWAAPGYKLQVTAADIYGNCPDPEDHSLFPSDHAAVKISMRLQKDITT